MRNRLITALGLGAFMTFASASAQALPVAPDLGASPLVQFAAEGCGRGAFRNRRGVCRPMRAAPRRGIGRRCFVQRTPHGSRRVCRR